MIAIFGVPSALSRPAAEPDAFHIWRPSAQPRAGQDYTGVVVTLFQEAEITMRPDSFRFHCGRASLTPPRKQRSVRHAHVRVLRLPDRGAITNSGNHVIGIWICTWKVPSGTAGWRMVGTYRAASVGRNPATGEELGPGSEGGRFEWTVRR